MPRVLPRPGSLRAGLLSALRRRSTAGPLSVRGQAASPANPRGELRRPIATAGPACPPDTASRVNARRTRRSAAGSLGPALPWRFADFIRPQLGLQYAAQKKPGKSPAKRDASGKSASLRGGGPRPAALQQELRVAARRRLERLGHVLADQDRRPDPDMCEPALVAVPRDLRVAPPDDFRGFTGRQPIFQSTHVIHTPIIAFALANCNTVPMRMRGLEPPRPCGH
jgi:hypothetical protein